MTSKEARALLLEQISTDQEFYKSLRRRDEGDEEVDQEKDQGDDDGVCYDEIDSSKKINEAIQDVMESTPADSLGDIYADEEDGLDESDAEDRGTGTNLGRYVGNDFSTRDATTRWMSWNAK